MAVCQLRAMASETRLVVELMSGRKLEIAVEFDRTRRLADLCYGLSRTLVRSDSPIPELEPFGVPSEGSPTAARDHAFDSVAGKYRSTYEGPGWIGGGLLDISCRCAGRSYELGVSGIDMLRMVIDDGTVFCGVAVPHDNPLGRHTFLGPGLALAFAENDRFSLHASAIQMSDRAVVLAGETGAGKSTLASRAHSLGLFPRLADDIVPLELDDSVAWTLPRLPQLKLSHDRQWLEPADVPLKCILTLQRRASVSQPALRELTTAEAVIRLLSHSVASRLYSADLKARHLDFCVKLARAVPVCDLEIPDDLDRLDEVVSFLAGELGSM